jgi:hypothetical protein
VGLSKKQKLGDDSSAAPAASAAAAAPPSGGDVAMYDAAAAADASTSGEPAAEAPVDFAGQLTGECGGLKEKRGRQ